MTRQACAAFPITFLSLFISLLASANDKWPVNFTDTYVDQDLYVRLNGNTMSYVGNKFQYKIIFGKNNDEIVSDTALIHFIKDSRLKFFSSSSQGWLVSGDTMLLKIPKSTIIARDSTLLLFEVNQATAFTTDSIRSKVIISPYEMELIQTNNRDSLSTKIRYQNAAISTSTFDLNSTSMQVGIEQVVSYTITHSFSSALDSTRGVIQLIKDPKTEFVASNLLYTINGDTITWKFSVSGGLGQTIQFSLLVKRPPAVQLGNIIINRAKLEYNTIDTAVLRRTDSLVQQVQYNCPPIDNTNFTLSPTQGIQWLRLFGGSGVEAAFSGTALSDSTFVVTMRANSKDGDATGSAAGFNAYAVKYNVDGSLIWKKEVGGNDFEAFYSVVKADQGSMILTGETFSTDGPFSGNHGVTDLLLTKLDSLGNTIWLKTLGGFDQEGSESAIQKYKDNQYIVYSPTMSNNGDVVNPYPVQTNKLFAWLFAIDGNGNILWQKVFPDTLFQGRARLQVLADGKFILAGGSRVQENVGGPTTYSGRIIKTDSTGTIHFLKNYKIPDHNSFITSIVVNPDSTLTFTGHLYPMNANTSCIGSHGSHDIWIGKTDKNGNLLWQKFYGGSRVEFSNHIIRTNDGGYLVSGQSYSDNGNTSGSHETHASSSDGWLLKLDANGNLIWQKMIGGIYTDKLNSAIQLPNNDIIAMGSTVSYNTGDITGSKGLEDAMVLKIGGAINTISGMVFVDANGDHIKNDNEHYFTTGIVKSVKGNQVRSSDIRNGVYRNNVDTGTYITQPVINSSYYTIFPATDTSRFNSYQQTDTVNFALVPVPGTNDLRVTLLSLSPARPGFKAQYYLQYENMGSTVIANGSVRFVKDKRSLFQTASINPSLQVADSITWNFSNLEPTQSVTISLELLLKPPPYLNNGDTLRHYATILPVVVDSTPENNRSNVNQVVQGSYDPNDKTETHGPGFEEQLLSQGEFLNYLIRFQNTGTDTAFRVIVRDTLSNKMDWNSFEMISASHPYLLSITDQNKLEWKFDPIILPDSNQNQAGSNGYVAFRIKPISTLVQGDTVTNKAGIYFDFNLPVITNLQKTVIAPNTLARPAIAGLETEYCTSAGMISGRISNPQALNTGVTTQVKLDNITLTIANDGSFTFNVLTLTPGSHKVSISFALGSTIMLTEWPFTVRQAGVLDLNLSANISNLTSPAQPLIITGANASGGSNLRYTYAKDRGFNNILQAEGSSNTLTLDPATLNPGINWIYGRINANNQCYTEQINIDSIQITVNFVTSIVDIDAAGREITIYPVPFDENLLLKGFSLSRKYDITLVNASGITMYAATISNRNLYEFKTSALPPGIYFVHIFKNGKKLGAVKVMKQ